MESARFELVLIIVSDNGFSIYPLIGWIQTMFLIILEFPLVHISILKVIFTLAIFLIIFPIPNILVSIIVSIDPITMSLIVVNFAIEYATIWIL